MNLLSRFFQKQLLSSFSLPLLLFARSRTGRVPLSRFFWNKLSERTWLIFSASACLICLASLISWKANQNLAHSQTQVSMTLKQICSSPIWSMQRQSSYPLRCISTMNCGRSTFLNLMKLSTYNLWHSSTLSLVVLGRLMPGSERLRALQKRKSSSWSRMRFSRRSMMQSSERVCWQKQSSPILVQVLRQCSVSVVDISFRSRVSRYSLKGTRYSVWKQKQAARMRHSFSRRKRFRKGLQNWLSFSSSGLRSSAVCATSFDSVSLMLSSWMPQVSFTFSSAFSTSFRIIAFAHCTYPVSLPRPALPAICWISCYSSGSVPPAVGRSMERKTIFLMLRLRPIPIALVATKQGSWPVLKLMACSFRHSGGSLPQIIAVQLFSFYTYNSPFSPLSTFSATFSSSSSFLSACISAGVSVASGFWLSRCSLSCTNRLMSFLCLRSEFMEKLMMQSPSLMFSNLNFLCISVSLLSLEYRFSSSVSPVSSRILLIMLSARSSPQRWMRLALTARIARVQAHPRSVSPII